MRNLILTRNGIYIERDVEYIETYKVGGEIANCADDGLDARERRRIALVANSAEVLKDDIADEQTVEANMPVIIGYSSSAAIS